MVSLLQWRNLRGSWGQGEWNLLCEVFFPFLPPPTGFKSKVLLNGFCYLCTLMLQKLSFKILSHFSVYSFWDTGSGIWNFCSLLSEALWNGKSWTLKVLLSNCGTGFLISHSRNTYDIFQYVCVLIFSFFLCTHLHSNTCKMNQTKTP